MNEHRSGVRGRGHRWTTEEMQELIGLWMSGHDVAVIAKHFGISYSGLIKVVIRLRSNGIPLPLRKKGHRAGRKNLLWTQEEVETLVRMRANGASQSEIASELNRTFSGVAGMIVQLRNNDIDLQKLAAGRARLWDAERLRAAVAGRGLRLASGDDND